MSEIKQRHCGIELLRMLSMFLICILHTLGQGMVLDYIHSGTAEYVVAWFLEISAYCAVNCYALISGFVGRKTKFKLSRPLIIWLEVVFYTLLITAVYALFKSELIVARSWRNAAFPIMYNQYWYMTAYIGMVVLSPVMNKAINELPLRTLSLTFAGILLIMCLLPTIFGVSVFGLSNGYSTLWLCIMYLTGGWVSRLREEKNFKPHAWISVVIYFLSASLSLLLKWISYTSPLILISGIALFLACLEFDPKSNALRSIITFLAPSSLAVYLIHVHPLIWADLVKGFAKNFADDPWYLLAIKTIGAALAIFFVCSIADLVRRSIFRIIHIKELLSAADSKLEKFLFKSRSTT